MPTSTRLYPENFLWGASTSSYQIEGAADADGRLPSIWDHFCRAPGKVFRSHTGDVACDHYHRMREDVALMKSLGLRAYRFSIAWPRVIPGGVGAPHAAGLDFYSRLVDELLAAGIEPWITLYHWDLPWSLHLRGGWLSPEMPDWFAAYTAAVVDRLSDRVTKWFTLNEPQVFIGLAYGNGVHAPGYKLTLQENLLAAHHALLAHGKAVQVIRARAKTPPLVGWAPVGISFRPATESAADIEAARLATFAVGEPGGHSPNEVHGMTWNCAWWMDPVHFGHYPADAWKRLEAFVPPIGPDDLKIISQPLDFFGANHYHAATVAAAPAGSARAWVDVPPEPGAPRTCMGWDVTPDSLYWASRFFHERYRLPIYYTENGTAATDRVSPDGRVHDTARVEFIRGYLVGLLRAVEEGHGVAGYFHWSLMDNFEWAEGYAQRFGLVHVDFATLKRTPKDSAWFYRDIIASRGASLFPGDALPA